MDSRYVFLQVPVLRFWPPWGDIRRMGLWEMIQFRWSCNDDEIKVPKKKRKGNQSSLSFHHVRRYTRWEGSSLQASISLGTESGWHLNPGLSRPQNYEKWILFKPISYTEFHDSSWRWLRHLGTTLEACQHTDMIIINT